jgi:CRISPR-associated protein Cas6/Cse3/CasE subtype I-E
MLHDLVITKPKAVAGYAVHRMVAGLAKDERPLFADMGDHILLRTDGPEATGSTPTRSPATGELVGFELRACVSKKRRGKHIYFPFDDWRSRHQWLARQGELHGFEVMTVHCRARPQRIDDSKGRRFTIDCTDFVGILKVTDARLFGEALASGIGSTGRAFGFGMLII